MDVNTIAKRLSDQIEANITAIRSRTDELNKRNAEQEKANTESKPKALNPSPDIIGKSNEGPDLTPRPEAPSYVPKTVTADTNSVNIMDDEEFFRSDNPLAYVVIGGGILTLGGLVYFASQ